MSKNDYYMEIAKAISKKGTCNRRNYGAIIVNNDEIIATGYTGSPRGEISCNKLKVCKREEMNIPSGERYEMCRSVHAEMNAIISAARRDMIGSTMYLYGFDTKTGKTINAEPCSICSRLIINAGIQFVMKSKED